MKGYKVFTHDLRSPIQGGEPVWDGSLPFELPTVDVDTSMQECGRGWNFCKEPQTSLRIGGLWPDGRPSRVFEVESIGTVVERGDKCRTDKLVICKDLSEEAINAAIYDLSKPFGKFRKHMTESQIAWRLALSRPYMNVGKIEEGLTEALETRGLDWQLRHFDTAWAARDAWDARDAWAARDAWDAWDAWAALTVELAALEKWTKQSPDYLIRGIRTAYENGLEIVIPTDPKELGWSEKR